MKKSKYAGVHQRKNGTWYYRIKKIVTPGENPTYFQQSGFQTEEQAYQARQSKLHLELFSSDSWHGEVPNQEGIAFGEQFQSFINSCDSRTTAQKYRALYNAQLRMWEIRDVFTIKDSDIDILLLKLSLQGYKESYISSIRKVIKKFFRYVHHIDKRVSGDIAQVQIAKPYKLRVLSLFSGIGAPEQALKELGIDFELVNFCEFDDTAAKAYCLLHQVDQEKDLIDVEHIDADYCDQALPNFDLMFFGSPCQDVSTSGKQMGLFKDNTYQPCASGLFHDEMSELTRSGLIYRAIQIALWKKPKFMVAENVSALMSRTEDFSAIVRNIQDLGYNIYFRKLNSRDFGIPQNRPRVFMVMVRSDLNMQFRFPEAIEKKTLSKTGNENWLLEQGWISDIVDDEYYYNTNKQTKLALKLTNQYDFNHYDYKEKEDIYEGFVGCITTSWGIPTYDRQAFVKDSKGVRCLTSKELMKFQGFPPDYADILQENGFSKKQIGKLVGNSITVPVIKEILAQLIVGLSNQLAMEAIPSQIIEAKIDDSYIQPLFSYMGNKSKLMPYLRYLMPTNLCDMTFVDLFGGSGTVAANVKADRVIINEMDNFLIGTYRALSTTPPDKAWKLVMDVINEYGLSHENEVGYSKCREDYNKIPKENREQYWYWGLALVYASYNTSHVSYNKSGEYNSSFGKDKMNLDNSKDRFWGFAQKLYEENFEFICDSYNNFKINHKRLDESFFYYADPPYLITKAPYNKWWGEQEEHELYAFLDSADEKGIQWMLSNVLENKGKRNEILYKWLNQNQWKYNIYYMQRDYKNSNYNSKNTGKTLEIVVTNYRTW